MMVSINVSSVPMVAKIPKAIPKAMRVLRGGLNPKATALKTSGPKGASLLRFATSMTGGTSLRTLTQGQTVQAPMLVTCPMVVATSTAMTMASTSGAIPMALWTRFACQPVTIVVIVLTKTICTGLSLKNRAYVKAV